MNFPGGNMYRRYYITLIAILLFVFASCTVNKNLKRSAQSEIRKPNQFTSVLCKGYITKTGSYKPIDVTNKFVKSEDEAVFLFTECFDSVPNTSYTPKWEWFGPKLTLIKSSCIK